MKDMYPVDYNGVRVLTTEQLAQAYECEPQRIKQNFNNNKDHFKEGKHFFKLEGEALSDLRVENVDLQISPMTLPLPLDPPWRKPSLQDARHGEGVGDVRQPRRELLQPATEEDDGS